ncbi:MAG: S8 family peptidase [Bacteroidota bacterium]
MSLSIRLSTLLSSLTLLPFLLCSQNWYHGQRDSSNYAAIGTDQLYEKIIKDKPGQQVIVAVIDSGVDIEHEDLKDAIWTNNDEIPNNGIDDDNNGYIDDYNGWNFIGGPNGEHVVADTYEMVRLYAAWRDRFNDVDPSTLSGEDLEEYNLWSKWGERIENETSSAKKRYDEYAAEAEVRNPIMNRLEEVNQSVELSESLIDSLGSSDDELNQMAANVLNFFVENTGGIPDIKTIRAEFVGPLQEPMDYFGSKWKYGWNPDYNPRGIVGDDYEDLSNRFYGNSSVEGPDAFHGTHVSGIIAASRDNELGVKGIANNAKIMVIRAVPDGDERDKDVANAIRYAVDNGASIINMSFGKGFSPNKQYVDDAIRHAEKNDVLIVHASGNSGQLIDVEDHDVEVEDEGNYPNDHFLNPKGFLFWKKKKPNNYLSIGASSQAPGENLPASFSNYGKEDVDIFAPGTMMLSTTPDDQYEIAQGTSMAAPVVSGIAALIRSYFPRLTAEQVKESILGSVQPLDVMVRQPGTEELVPFSELSVTGGVVNVEQAFLKAARMKGKKRIAKRNKMRA